jgi:hypothetical protein
MNVFFGAVLLYLIGSGLLREFGRIVFWLRKVEGMVARRRSKGRVEV